MAWLKFCGRGITAKETLCLEVLSLASILPDPQVTNKEYRDRKISEKAGEIRSHDLLKTYHLLYRCATHSAVESY